MYHTSRYSCHIYKKSLEPITICQFEYVVSDRCTSLQPEIAFKSFHASTNPKMCHLCCLGTQCEFGKFPFGSQLVKIEKYYSIFLTCRRHEIQMVEAEAVGLKIMGRILKRCLK